MTDSIKLHSLKPLHPDSQLNPAKLAGFDPLSTEILLNSLVPGKDKGCLKTRRDGTILDGHHRVLVLPRRGVDVDKLPREVIERGPEERNSEDADPTTLA